MEKVGPEPPLLNMANACPVTDAGTLTTSISPFVLNPVGAVAVEGHIANKGKVVVPVPPVNGAPEMVKAEADAAPLMLFPVTCPVPSVPVAWTYEFTN